MDEFRWQKVKLIMVQGSLVNASSEQTRGRRAQNRRGGSLTQLDIPGGWYRLSKQGRVMRQEKQGLSCSAGTNKAGCRE